VLWHKSRDFQVFSDSGCGVRALFGSVRSPVQIRAPRYKKAPATGADFSLSRGARAPSAEMLEPATTFASTCLASSVASRA
jgi:hypothetical protein